MNRKVEVTLGILIIAIFVLIVGKNVLAIAFDETYGINKLKAAIEREDIKYLKTHLKVEKYNQSLTDEDIKRIGKLLKDPDICGKLSNYYNTKDLNISIVKDGKENLFLDKYIIVLKPYTLILDSNISKTKVIMDGKEIGEINDECIFEHNLILPGKHNFQLKYNNDYVDLEEEEEILFFDDYVSEIYHSIYLDGKFINVDSNYYDAKLFVNNVDTGKTIGEIDSFGPIPLDGSITIQAKLNTSDGTLESEKVTVDDNFETYYLEIIEEEKYESDNYSNLEYAVKDLINYYEENMVKAINENDFSLVSYCMVTDSPLYKAQNNLVANLNEKGIKEELINYQIYNISNIENNRLFVYVYENHYIHHPNGDVEEVEHNWKYTINISFDGYIELYDIAKD